MTGYIQTTDLRGEPRMVKQTHSSVNSSTVVAEGFNYKLRYMAHHLVGNTHST